MARRLSVESATSSAHRRLIRAVRPGNRVQRYMSDVATPPTSSKRGARILVTVFAVVVLLVVGWCSYVYQQRSFKLLAMAPDRRVEVRGLPFKALKPHPLDWCLRVYTYGLEEHFESDVWQTTIPWSTDLEIEWVEPQRFILSRGEERLMVWSVAGESASCEVGKNLITYDPHELWMRTGKPTP